MTTNGYYEALEGITIDHTTIINGNVVTRFSKNAFEIDTFGKAYFDIHKAVDVLQAS